MRIRAAQALAVIAQHDYALIKDRVLEPWSASNRRIQHQAAAWLLEAMVLEGTVAEKVKDLLRRWSRSGDELKRAVAVRAYGTAVARSEPLDAIRGVRFSAADPLLGALPELALREMYLLGLTREVMTELPLWMRGFPADAGAGRPDPGAGLPGTARDERLAGPYDLLWRLAHAPDEVGVGMPEVAALWHLACQHEPPAAPPGRCSASGRRAAATIPGCAAPSPGWPTSSRRRPTPTNSAPGSASTAAGGPRISTRRRRSDLSTPNAGGWEKPAPPEGAFSARLVAQVVRRLIGFLRRSRAAACPR